MKKLAVIVPIYQKQLNEEEQHSVEICAKKMSEYDLYFIMPKKLNEENYKQYTSFHIKRFPNKYFKGTDTYNKLMLNPRFYKEFSEYDYILIAQTDTLILGNAYDFKRFLDMDYDYYGAPWEIEQEFYFYTTKSFLYKYFRLGKEVLVRVGNGGFSLRRVDKTIKLLNEKKLWRLFWRGNEDFFFACYGEDNNCSFTLAPVDVARQFSLETNMREHLELGEHPFAVHKWQEDYKTFDEIKRYVS